MRLIIIDTLNAFQWQERNGHVGPATISTIVTNLVQIIDENGTIVVGTRINSDAGVTSGADKSSVVGNACKEWNDRVTRKITVS